MGKMDKNSELWAGEFGDEYTDRNAFAPDRSEFWNGINDQLEPAVVLEVGCGTGHNLNYFQGISVGVDVNVKALSIMMAADPCLVPVKSPANDLPFLDDYFDLVFCVGLLIHQTDNELVKVVNEMTRVTGKYLLVGEYYSQYPEMIEYRGHKDFLFKRDYGEEVYSLTDMELIWSKNVGVDQGFDNVTFWLFKK